MAAILDGSRPIPAEAWEPVEGRPGVYVATVSPEFATVTQDDPDHSNTFHCAAWKGDDLLTSVFEEGSIDANLDALELLDEGFTAHIEGSTNPDPRTGDDGGDYLYYVKTANDPRVSGEVFYYAEQAGVVALPFGSTMRDLTIQRSAAKDMSGAAGSDNLLTTIDRVIFRDAACHAWVGGPVQFNDCEAYGRGDGRNRRVGGYGLHFYRSESIGAALPQGSLRCYARDFAIGYGSHGGGTGPENSLVTLTDSEAGNCNTGVSCGWSEDGWIAPGFVATRCRRLAQSNLGGLTIKASASRRSSYLSELTGDCLGIDLWGDALLEDTDLVFESGDSNTLYLNGRAQFDANPDLFFTLTLRRVTATGLDAAVINNSFYKQVDLVLEDCDLGELWPSGVGYPFRSLVATGSTFGLGGKTLSEIRADHPGVDGTNTII